MDKVKNVRVIQEFKGDLGLRGIYEFEIDGVVRVCARKDNNLYAIVHLSEKPELMLVRSDVRDEIFSVLK